MFRCNFGLINQARFKYDILSLSTNIKGYSFFFDKLRIKSKDYDTLY